jgi:hypothetical protein
MITEGTWLTEGGYIVKLDSELRASVEHSPGLASSGRCSKEAKTGWGWEKDGSIFGLKTEWCKRLRIVQKLSELPQLPSGYKWKDGYPLVREVELGEEYLSLNSSLDEFKGKYSFKRGSGTLFSYSPIFGEKRLVVEPTKIEPPISLEIGKTYLTRDGFIIKVNKNAEFFTSNKPLRDYEKNGKCITSLSDPSKYDIVSEIEVPDKLRGHSPEDVVWDDVKKVWKKTGDGIQPSQESVDKLRNILAGDLTQEKTSRIGSLSKKVANYFIIEPVADAARVAIKSARYVLLASLISGGIYSFANPERATRFAHSLVPKVSISFEKPEIMK